jgi:anti-sigma-K factor RskA
MSLHEQFAEDLALHALGALTGDERARLEQHLSGCVDCRRELEQLRGDTALLALSTLGPKPPGRARQRLLDAVAREKIPTSRPQNANEIVHQRPRRSWWGWLGWAATVAVLVFAAALWKENSALKRDLFTWRALVSQQNLELEQARNIARVVTNPEAQHFTLVTLKARPQPQGKAIYVRDRANLIFMANNLLPLAPQKAYQLWLIPVQGAPIPAGVFKPNARGTAVVINPPLPAGTEAKAFAITVENEAGSATPTPPILMMGAGE